MSKERGKSKEERGVSETQWQWAMQVTAERGRISAANYRECENWKHLFGNAQKNKEQREGLIGMLARKVSH